MMVNTTASRATRAGRAPQPEAAMAQAKKSETPRDIIPGMEGLHEPTAPPSLKWEVIGETHTLTVDSGRPIQDRDYKTNKPLLWPSGDPKMIATYSGTDEAGHERTLYVRGERMTRAFREAMKEAAIPGIAKGDQIEVVWVGDDEVPPPNGRGESTFAHNWFIEIKAV